MLARPGVLVSVGVLVLASALVAAEPDDHADDVVSIEQANGHRLVSREVYRRGEQIRAGVHASHPIHGLGYRLWRPVTAVDKELGNRLQAALKEPGRAVEARKASARIRHGGGADHRAEYQDAWGFFQELRAAWSALRRSAGASERQMIATVEERAILTF